MITNKDVEIKQLRESLLNKETELKEAVDELNNLHRERDERVQSWKYRSTPKNYGNNSFQNSYGNYNSSSYKRYRKY